MDSRLFITLRARLWTRIRIETLNWQLTLHPEDPSRKTVDQRSHNKISGCLKVLHQTDVIYIPICLRRNQSGKKFCFMIGFTIKTKNFMTFSSIAVELIRRRPNYTENGRRFSFFINVFQLLDLTINCTIARARFSDRWAVQIVCKKKSAFAVSLQEILHSIERLSIK